MLLVVKTLSFAMITASIPCCGMAEKAFTISSRLRASNNSISTPSALAAARAASTLSS